MEAAKLLQDKGAEVTVRDNGDNAKIQQRAAELRARGVTVETGVEVKNSCLFDLGILSPGINPKVPLVQNLAQAHVPLLGELEMAFRFCECPIVAITGTNGKTTTTDLITAALKAGEKRTLSSGNIGNAFSAAVRHSAELDVMVLEASAFQLETTQEFRPRVSVFTNFSPNDLDRYATVEEYRNAKWMLFKNQTQDDYAVVNANVELPKNLKAKKITFSAYGQKADYQLADGWLCARGEPVLEMSRTQLMGPHNAENILCALAVADLYNVPRRNSIEAICSYRPRAHRCEPVGEVDGVLYINDSKSTTLDALEKALTGMTRPTVLIAGGKEKGLEYDSLRSLLREKVKGAVLIGEIRHKLREVWGSAVPCHAVETLAEAVDKASEIAAAGDAVLLSPGTFSYDMFRNYEDRGEQFRQLVLARTKQTTTKPRKK